MNTDAKLNEQGFHTEVNALMQRYGVQLKVVVSPANRFTKAVHWLVRRILRYESAIFIKSNAPSEPIPNVE